MLEAESIRVAYPKRVNSRTRHGHTLVAVRDVDLCIGVGETLALVGESGCGKTSLGLALLRLIALEKGTVRFDGRDITQLRGTSLRCFRSKMQMVFQDSRGSLHPLMTVAQIIADPLIGNAAERRAELPRRTDELLEQVGLPPEFKNRRAHELSGGQRQRVAIARALSLRPQLLVCDEPVNALDVPAQVGIMELLRKLKRLHTLSYLFITHDLELAAQYSDRIAVMYAGRIVETISSVEIAEKARHPYTQMLWGSILRPDPAERLSEFTSFGEPPALFERIEGCPYHPRCPLALSRCREVEPSLAAVGRGHVACHCVDGCS